MSAFTLPIDVDEFDCDIGLAIAHAFELIFTQQFFEILANDPEFVLFGLFRDGYDDFDGLFELANVSLRFGCQRISA